MTTAELDVKFTKTSEFITISKKTLEEGGEVDLTGLDEQVAELCGAVAQMEPLQAGPYAQKLQAMMVELNQVAELLKQRHAEIIRQIEALNQQKQAATAYTQTKINNEQSSEE